MIAQTKGPLMGQTRTQAVLVTNQATINENQTAIDLALFDETGAAVEVPKPLSVITVAGLIDAAAKTTTSAAPPVGLVPIKFTSGNSAAAPTVAFNGGAAKAVLLGGTAPADTEIAIGANGIALFFYDGTNLHQIGVYT